MSSLTVHQILEGSVLVLKGVEMDEETVDVMMKYIIKATGHTKFCIIHLPDDEGTVDIWGPDTDLQAKIEELLNEGS